MARVKKGIGIVVLYLCIFAIAVSLADGTEEEKRKTPDDFPGSRPESRTAGLEKLYEMAVTFLDDWVVPYEIGELIEDYNITVFDDFAQPAFYDRWREWGKHYIGLTMTFLVGVLFAVFMPLIGLLFCCCRYCCCECCCSCCRTPKKGKTSSCKKGTCGFFLFGFTVLMLASGTCVFLTQDELVTELGPEGFFRDVTYSMDALGKYVNDTLDEIEEIAIVGVTDAIDDVMATLKEIPDSAIDGLNNATQAEDLLKTLIDFVDNLQPLSTNLSVMVNSTNALAALQGQLDTSLTDSQTSLEYSLDYCINSSSSYVKNCTDLKNELTKLQTEADFASINTDPADLASRAIQDELDKGTLQQSVDAAVDAFYKIEETVRNTTNETIGGVEEDLDEILAEITAAWEELQDDISDLDIDGAKDTVDEFAVKVHDAMDSYYTWFYLGIVGVITLVGLFNALGLVLGTLCSSPKASSSCTSCTSAQGGCCLMVGVFLVFLLGWLLMLLTIGFYAVGGGTEFLFCRHLVVYDSSMEELERVAFNSFDVRYNISVRQLIDDCKNDTALYTSLRLEDNGFNISELLDLQPVYDAADELKNVTVDIGTVVIVTDTLNTTMMAIDGVLDAVTFDEYAAETQKDLVQIDLRQFMDELFDLATKLNDTGDIDVGAYLTAEALKLNQIITDSIVPMEAENKTLTSAVADAETITEQADASQLIVDLTKAESAINTDAPEIISDVIGGTTDSVVRSVEDYITTTERNIMNDLAGCYPIYDTLKTMTYSTCIYFLYPFNSVWFCVGWFLFCCVFTLIFGTKMAGYFSQIPEDNDQPPNPNPNRQSQQATRQSQQDMEMHARNNMAYLPPDYDDVDPSPPPPPPPGSDLRHPGVHKPPKSSASINADPPPKYEDCMKEQIRAAEQINKQRKAEKKQQQKQQKTSKV